MPLASDRRTCPERTRDIAPTYVSRKLELGVNNEILRLEIARESIPSEKQVTRCSRVRATFENWHSASVGERRRTTPYSCGLAARMLRDTRVSLRG